MSIKLSINNIPDWIKNNKSKLYDSFDSNFLDDLIIIPINKYEENINILNINDLYKYLDICVYVTTVTPVTISSKYTSI